MNTNSIRWIDKYIGQPLCFILTIHRRLQSLFSAARPSQQRPSKIIFIKLTEQGSTVLAYPAIKKAIRLVGRDNAYFLLFRENRPVLDLLDVVPAANIIEVSQGSIFGFIATSLKAIVRMRREKIGSALDLEFFSRGSAVFAYLSGAVQRVGLHRFNTEGPFRGDLFTHRLLYNPYLHTRTFFLSLVEALLQTPVDAAFTLNFKTPVSFDDLPHFEPGKEEGHVLRGKIEGIINSRLGSPIFIFNPNTSDLLPLRRWPEEKFIRLGEMLRQEFPAASILLTGTAKEKQNTEAIASKIRGGFSLAGHTSLRELVVLFSMADCLVTNDSGPAHFSCLTPIKSVVLFGPETPLLYGPEQEGKCVLHSSLACSPCINVYNYRKSPCKKGLCLERIGVEQVYGKIIGLLKESPLGYEACLSL